MENYKQVPNTEKYYALEDGTVINSGSGKPLKQWLNPNGYYYVVMSVNGNRVSRTVHSIIAECFVGERPCGLVVDHIDGNPHNNNASNLQYITQRENVKKGKLCK
jgi:hypothetical protein